MPAQSKGAAAAKFKLVGNCGQSLNRRDHVVSVAAVIVNARHSKIAAGDEITAPTAVAHEAYPAEPANSNSLAHLPGGHFRAELIDAAGNLMPRHCGIAEPGKVPVTAKTSLWQMPHASTLRRTSRGLGSEIGRSTNSSGAFGSLTCTTRM